jgi:hypothetical protein
MDEPERAAIEELAKYRWTGGFVCPKCRTRKFRHRTRNFGPKRQLLLWKCGGPGRHETSVTAGTVLERSHVSLARWLQAAKLISDEIGVSAQQFRDDRSLKVVNTKPYRLQRELGVSFATARLMRSTIEDAMRGLPNTSLTGGRARIGRHEILQALMRSNATSAVLMTPADPARRAANQDGSGRRTVRKLPHGRLPVDLDC